MHQILKTCRCLHLWWSFSIMTRIRWPASSTSREMVLSVGQQWKAWNDRSGNENMTIKKSVQSTLWIYKYISCVLGELWEIVRSSLFELESSNGWLLYAFKWNRLQASGSAWRLYSLSSLIAGLFLAKHAAFGHHCQCQGDTHLTFLAQTT